MLIDTHCHLSDPAFDGDRDAVIARMRDATVSRCLVIESVLGRLGQTLEWARGIEGVRVATGCHPHDALTWDAALAERMQDVWANPSVAGAGEMGLDYHYDHAPRDVQRKVFADQLALAVSMGKPVIIHAREADEDVISILNEQPNGVVVLHSFSSGKDLAEAGLRAGWYFSFSGMITFKSWTETELLRQVPLERLLVETDSPYLAPVPHRGKRNEPAFIVDTARKLAEVRGMSIEALSEVTSANAARLFWRNAGVEEQGLKYRS